MGVKERRRTFSRPENGNERAPKSAERERQGESARERETETKRVASE